MEDLSVLLIAVLCSILVSFCFGWLHEWKSWNCGIAPSGKRWIRFDTDSANCRGYTDDCGHVCWISFPFIDSNYDHTLTR